jgi:hypothetical protein
MLHPDLSMMDSRAMVASVNLIALELQLVVFTVLEVVAFDGSVVRFLDSKECIATAASAFNSAAGLVASKEFKAAAASALMSASETLSESASCKWPRRGCGFKSLNAILISSGTTGQSDYQTTVVTIDKNNEVMNSNTLEETLHRKRA